MPWRAHLLAHLSLGVKEKVYLLKTWILPCVFLAARAYYPDSKVVAKLCKVYQVALSLSSWGLLILWSGIPPCVDFGGGSCRRAWVRASTNLPVGPCCCEVVASALGLARLTHEGRKMIMPYCTGRSVLGVKYQCMPRLHATVPTTHL